MNLAIQQKISSAEQFGKVAVLLGGLSAEREISLKSGSAVLQALLARGVNAVAIDANQQTLMQLQEEQFDRTFVALHGRWGEGGIIQGGLESINLPYTGSGVAASAIAMNKVTTKQIWQSYGLPTAKFIVAQDASDLAAVKEELGFPVFVKPANEGSSIGISRVDSLDQLLAAFEVAQQQDDQVLIEQFIDGSEITIGILNGQSLPVIQIEVDNDFYDYEAKYQSNDTQYHCPAGLSDSFEMEMRALALQAFNVLGAKGWGRVDIMLDQQQNPYLIELNTVPGMTDHSLVPMAAKQAGLSFEQLCWLILESSL